MNTNTRGVGGYRAHALATAEYRTADPGTGVRFRLRGGLIFRPKRSDAGIRARFDAWLKMHRAYDDAVQANGGTLWSKDYEERYELWKRRYQRPTPPDLPVRTLREMNERANRFDPTEPITRTFR